LLQRDAVYIRIQWTGVCDARNIFEKQLFLFLDKDELSNYCPISNLSVIS